MNCIYNCDFLLMFLGQNISSQTKCTVLLGIDREQWGIDNPSSERIKIDSVLEQILNTLEPVCFSEQQFCISFFQVR